MVALNYWEIEPHPEIVSDTKPFINKYIWKGLIYPSASHGCKKCEKNNTIIALNILSMKEKEICPV